MLANFEGVLTSYMKVSYGKLVFSECTYSLSLSLFFLPLPHHQHKDSKIIWLTLQVQKVEMIHCVHTESLSRVFSPDTKPQQCYHWTFYHWCWWPTTITWSLLPCLVAPSSSRLPPSLPVSDCLPTLPEVGQQIIRKFWEVWECMAHKLVAFLFSTTPEAPMVDILQVGTKYIHTLHQVVKAFFSFVGCYFLHHPSSHAYHISFWSFAEVPATLH